MVLLVLHVKSRLMMRLGEEVDGKIRLHVDRWGLRLGLWWWMQRAQLGWMTGLLWMYLLSSKTVMVLYFVNLWFCL